ncbi:two-component regulator propeller domain-containing protein [Symmachiella dynata]|uniref:two-component regulator propeller domain-containing protein n=1 Tax=Symmachiella dynata TaxID=2527995 RepID=UPI0030ECA2CB
MKRIFGSLWVVLLAATFTAVAPAITNAADKKIVDKPFLQDYRGPFIKAAVPKGQDVRKSGNNIRAIAVDTNDTIWAATADGLMQVQEDQLVSPEGATVDGSTYAVLANPDGSLWVGAWNGLFRIADGQVTQDTGIEGPVTLLRRTGKRLFAATPRGLFEKTDDAWKKVEGPWATNIYDVVVAGDDLYIAAWSGLYRQSAGETQWLQGKEQALSRRVNSLAADRNGHVWIGSAAGIDIYRDGRRVAAITPEQGLPSTSIQCLNLGHDGRLWVGTAIGAARFDGKSWSFRHSLRWLPNDNVRDIEFLKDGSAVIATADGISIIRQREMTLESKADFFEKLVRARHVRPPGLMERCRLAVAGDISTFEPMDTDNDGMYTGLYMAAESYRYAVTKAADAKANATEAFRAMEFLQTVTGTPGFVARTVIPVEWDRMADGNRTYTDEEAADHFAREARWKKVENRWRKSADGKWLWKGDTSSDEITGHFFSYPIYYDLVADEAEKKRVAALVGRIMDHIIEGGYVLRDIDGEATRWGVWSPEKLNDDPNWWLERGVNSVEALTYLTIAKHVTGDEKYDREIDRLLYKEHYAENILKPLRTGNDYFTYIGYQLLAFCYPALLTYEQDPARRVLYRESMEAWFAPVRRDDSPLFGFVYAAFSGGDAKLSACAELLRDVPLDQIQYTIHNSQREDVEVVGIPVEGRRQTRRLLPPSERAVFRWDRNVYFVDHGAGGRWEGSTAFWLMPYWMGRYYDLITPPEK